MDMESDREAPPQRIYLPTLLTLWLASPHYLKSIQHFVQHIKEVKLEPGEVMTSYDIKALFTSVPLDPSINIVKKVQQDPLLYTTNSHTPGVLPQKHLLPLPG